MRICRRLGFLTENKNIFNFARQLKLKVQNSFQQQAKEELNDLDDDMIPNQNFKGFKSSIIPEARDNEKFDEEHLKIIQETVLYKGDDPYYKKLVERQQKGVVWGLGGELLRNDFKQFNINEEINQESIINFLELNQIKDIEIIDISQHRENYQYRYGIIGSMYSSQHGWKVCKDLAKVFETHWEQERKQRNKKSEETLKQAFKDKSTYGLFQREIENKKILGVGSRPQVSGMKDDEWLMVAFRQYMIHLVNEDSREELALADKFKYQHTKEDEIQNDRFTKGKKALFEPLN